MISNIDHPGNFPFSLFLGAYSTSTEYLRLNYLEIDHSLGPESAHSFRYFVCSVHFIYANSTVNIGPSTPLRCRDSDASQ
ncbi:uncharacterized protein N7487_006589 [Penicillium crustosum]|uniref:uncharacterized protein n=1 Tax=Penicillium crustosum TaxID=36656 RepID=UPI002385BBC3|nr:uncharacterized protein N7487_006589 [Penicillium crustosum]KAJ5412230.1 hypothetical protein N7487_006589 [Penicillium crustosum]